ncbi:hypothetical protein GGR26_000029 [Lewinella marina]|uniref:RagB/SusD family nutrient uptake outer membrane protein n=1 Tax=Neolewinella marina TaxID=438751 RepID=A0A2G0CAY9_9BACT|nr:RagB/SusD family nutrient uptake outer membrane protein [Neolewinella marina]NJB84284.1 hypothetical protein [Neolewinella marina]PHK97133.1 RagB/SusD family nutrient uptake outer membrane protein [Neolewinella marina]
MKAIYHYLLVVCFVGFTACEGPLEEEIFSELAPSTLFTSESGIEAVLNSAYAYSHRSGYQESWAPLFMQGMTAGEAHGLGGSIESLWASLITFTWDANHAHVLAMWTVYYNAIRDANLVLDNLDNEALSADFRQRAAAEVHFLRGWNYAELYNLYGPVPVYTSSTDAPLQPRASDAEMRALIETELQLAIEGLPAEPLAYGKATRGAAMGILTKFYLNTRQWQKAADMAQRVIDSGDYGLVPVYSDVFAVANEGNREMVWALPKSSVSGTTGQAINALLFPPDYPRPYPNNGVFAARTYLFDDFVNSFAEGDTRRDMIVTEYVSTSSGQRVGGLGFDRSFPYKYEFDPNSVGVNSGNDLPVVRYADILISRAEALNELEGPTQEAIDLVSQVRQRAGAEPLRLADYDQASLRDAILREREWEFWFEAKRREDQLRHGRFIAQARDRGHNAEDFHVLFPLPQVEMNANNLLEQNTGY